MCLYFLSKERTCAKKVKKEKRSTKLFGGKRKPRLKGTLGLFGQAFFPKERLRGKKIV